MIPNDSKRFPKIPKDSKRLQKVLKESKKAKRIQRIQKKACIFAKHSSVLAEWPKKLISPPNPLKFKKLDMPALLGRPKIEKFIRNKDTKQNRIRERIQEETYRESYFDKFS